MDLNKLTLRSREDPLAMQLLSGELAEGARILVDREGDGLSFRTT